jgi:hypothetical protein
LVVAQQRGRFCVDEIATQLRRRVIWQLRQTRRVMNTRYCSIRCRGWEDGLGVTVLVWWMSNLRIDKAINFFGVPSLGRGGRKLVRTPHTSLYIRFYNETPFLFNLKLTRLVGC